MKIVSIIGMSLVAVLACKSPAKEAEKAICGFSQSVRDHKLDSARNFLSRESWDIWDVAMELAGKEISEGVMDISKQSVKCKIKDDKGVCIICCAADNAADTNYVIKQNGSWKIDLMADPKMEIAKQALQNAGSKENLLLQMKAVRKLMEEGKLNANMLVDSAGIVK